MSKQREYNRDELGRFAPKGYSSTKSIITTTAERAFKAPKKRRNFTLSKTEFALYYKKLADLKVKYGENYLNDGEFPRIKIDNKIIISTGSFENPTIIDVIEIAEDD